LVLSSPAPEKQGGGGLKRGEVSADPFKASIRLFRLIS